MPEGHGCSTGADLESSFGCPVFFPQTILPLTWWHSYLTLNIDGEARTPRPTRFHTIASPQKLAWGERRLRALAPSCQRRPYGAYGVHHSTTGANSLRSFRHLIIKTRP